MSFSVKSQLTYNEEGKVVPFSMSEKYRNLIDTSKVNKCILKSYNNDSLYYLKNIDNDVSSGAYQAGFAIDTLISLKTMATKYKIKEGTLWIYKIYSKTAEMIDFTINQINIPDGGYIHIFPKKEESDKIGPKLFLKKDIISSDFHQHQYGNQLLIEYFEPNGFDNTNDINITKLYYIFRSPLKKKSNVLEIKNDMRLKSGHFGNAKNTCQLNVVCPEASAWAKESRSIIYIFTSYRAIDGAFYFFHATGFFINKSNNYSNTDHPYILTVGHGLSKWIKINNVLTNVDLSNQISEFEFRVNYRDEKCDDPEQRTGQYLPGTFNIVTRGSSYNKHSQNDPSYEQNEDYALLQYSESVLSLKKYNILYAGWTANPNFANTSYASIGHPNGDVQKVLIENGAGEIPFNGRYVRFYFDKGVSEGGFSGSPAFNSSKKVVGWLCTASIGSCSNVGQNIDATTCGRFDKLHFNIASYIDPTFLNQANDSEPTPPPAPTLPSHCSNCLQDADETGIDCGGTCLPCGMEDVLILKTQADVVKNNISARYELNTEPDLGYQFKYISGTFNLNAGHSVQFKNNVLIKEGVTLKAAAIPALMSEPPRGCQTICLSPANVFTPNGDGANDYWIFSQAFINQYSLIVKNRWGQTVFSKSTTPIFENGIVRGWDGTGISSNDTYYIWLTTTSCSGAVQTNTYPVSVFGLKSANLNELYNGITENSNLEEGFFRIIAYPNPTLGKISIEANNCDTNFEYIISDISGKILMNDSNVIGSALLDLSSYPSGTYLIRAKTGDDIQTCKLIKK